VNNESPRGVPRGRRDPAPRTAQPVPLSPFLAEMKKEGQAEGIHIPRQQKKWSRSGSIFII
jgi:hypothetical protein